MPIESESAGSSPSSERYSPKSKPPSPTRVEKSMSPPKKSDPGSVIKSAEANDRAFESVDRDGAEVGGADIVCSWAMVVGFGVGFDVLTPGGEGVGP